MKIKSIQLGEDGLPIGCEVVMTITEAAQIACVFGEFSDKALSDRGWKLTHIYSDLCGDLFNRFWDDGLDGAAK